MAVFDGRLIDPTEAVLTRALGKAMRAANADNRYQANRMARDAEFWGRFARDVLRGGPEGRRRSCKGGRAVPEVVAGWWTDPAGRKHVRVRGRTRQRFARLRRETELRGLPPWWHVYPETVLGTRGTMDAERYLAVCRCGAVGAPGSLGWMGDTCGPCFDRRADGGTPAGGYGQFAGWFPSLSHFAFTADSRHLLGQNRAGAFWKVNRDDGTAATAKRKSSVNLIAATGRNETGVVMVLQEGSVFHWPADRNELDQVLPGRQMWGRAAVPPDGSRVALVSYQRAFVADLTVARPKYLAVEIRDVYAALQFAPDGTRLLAATASGDICGVDPETMTPTVLRRDAFDGLPPGSGAASELAVSGDGSSVLVRRESNSPRVRSTVRHVPLAAGAVVELRVPEWHRPTAVAYSPDGRHAIMAEAGGGWVGFWETGSGKSLGFVRAVLEDRAWRCGQIGFAPDGRALAVSYNTGHHDHGSTVAVWPWPDVLSAAG